MTSSPESAIKIGDSSKCGVEALLSKDKRTLSFQSHPEYTEEYIHAFEARMLNSEESARKRDEFHHKSIEIIRKTMRSFIDWHPSY